MRLHGVKAVKKQKVLKNHELASVENSAAHMSGSVSRIEVVFLRCNCA